MNPHERRYLEGLVHLKTKPTLLHNLTFRPVFWLPFFGMVFIGILFIITIDPCWGMFLTGISFGAILRIVAHARQSMALWKITEEITDWTKVDNLLQGK